MEWFRIMRTMKSMSGDELRSVASQTVPLLDGCTLLLVRSHGGVVEEYIRGEKVKVERVGSVLGFTVEASGEPAVPDGLRLAHALIPLRARLNYVSSVKELRENAVQTRQGVEASLGEDSYAAVTFRHADWVENRHIRDWVADEENMAPDSNPLVGYGRLLCRVSVGDRGDAATVVRSVAHAFMPLLSDVASHPSCPRLGLPASMGALAALSGGAWWGLASLPLPVPVGVYDGLKALLAISLILTILGVIRFCRRSVWDDILQRPRRRWWRVNRRKGRLSGAMTNTGGEQKDNGKYSRELAYPLQRTTLISPAYTVATLIIPTANGRQVAQDAHPAPDALTAGGVYLGEDETGRKTYLDETQLYRGIAILGKTGSGKSVLMTGIMQWADSHRTTTPPTVWGEDSRVIDLVMKDDSNVAVMQAYRKRHDLPAAHVCRLLDPQSPSFDLLGLWDGLDARTTGGMIASRMQYSFNKGDIMKDSLSILGQAFTIGVAAQRVESAKPGLIANRVRTLEPKYAGCEDFTTPLSPVGWASVALAGTDGGVAVARALHQVVTGLARDTTVPEAIRADCLLAAQAGVQLYGRIGDNGRPTISDSIAQQRMQASRNKADLLLKCETVFDPKRARIRWTQLLDHPGDYHIILAPDAAHQYTDANMPNILGSWLVHTLWETIRSQCGDWQANGKHIMVYCDELSMLAKADEQSLVALKEQGRSYGLMLVFATQYPNQLPTALLDSFLDYDTVMTFDHPDALTAGMLCDRRFHTVDGDGWNGGVIQGLPLYHAAVRTRTKRSLQPPFIVTVHDFSTVLG